MPDEASLLRHSIRGTINALKLGVSAMDTGLTRDEAIEFLDYIIQATDQMSRQLEEYEALPDSLKPAATAGG
jgi:signal transduction histidine kinase